LLSLDKQKYLKHWLPKKFTSSQKGSIQVRAQDS